MTRREIETKLMDNGVWNVDYGLWSMDYGLKTNDPSEGGWCKTSNPNVFQNFKTICEAIAE